MKKIMIALTCLTAFSCATTKIQEVRQPAQTGNMGSFIASTGNNVGTTAVICTAVCEVYVPNKTNDPKIDLATGSYLSGRALMVSNGSTLEVATEKLRSKCSETSPVYRIYKSLDVDLNEETDSLEDKTYAYDPNQRLSSSNAHQFCQTGLVTEFIHYASGKSINKDGIKLKSTHKNPN